MTSPVPVSRVAALGDRVLALLDDFGGFGLLAARTVRSMSRPHFPWRAVLQQFESTVVRSTSIVILTALFTGMVLALQTVVSLTRFGAKAYTGSFVGLAQVLELGPVLTAVMVSGRVGAGITAEIGSMAVTEQVDAIRALGADPVQKLVLPRVLALTLGVPLLTILADFMGVFGGLVIATQYGISSNFYVQTVLATVNLENFAQGVTKTFFFGWTIAMVGCYRGLTTEGGTVGVGRATTQAVVTASISVFILDFFLSQLMIIL
ncbi:MAG: ABC transporter permease [Proteobacteria bacterium]|nr:ABC transporter permease [Pseudomonadota bacterium]MCZ6784249.1 ABC transporter permease [Pseudomonadota bacterium]